MTGVEVSIPERRQYVRTLTTGWRFTIPTPIRQRRGWNEGSVLRVMASGPKLIFSDWEGSSEVADATAHPGTGYGEPVRNLAKLSGSSPDVHREKQMEASCYVGSGGKVVVPRELRKATGWAIGERLSIKEDEEGVSVAPCCPKKRCRSCGSTVGVREVIPNLYLCVACLEKYVSSDRDKHIAHEVRAGRQVPK
ncbi:MAG: AbrB/MazE/SpoVT family DNA-binding domain-containing protein [Candidatus Fermentithermobacillus carboniphilus]|uniref:AbrB/MazE/SpoVT family DNA-binding domain-containing protein n=1 Tax=Candidatus Fermentithermobacillus carboniphilus TaxID=3085328 RepID=A0AAT9LD60_9FIRM|nr:MAG: AbrB/MazE/SpoVT family DNA-binding domain-containing protein [Candidatus Fermentithermobacillus carboniphilus]